MAKESTSDKEFFRKQDNKLYFSIPSNDKRRKTFLGLDGTGFLYLIGFLIPILIVAILLVYFIQFKELNVNPKALFGIIFFMFSYVAVGWTLCSHDSNTGKQTFSVLYQMIKYRAFQPKMVRPKFANRKNTILKIGVNNDYETNQEEHAEAIGRTITTESIYKRRREQEEQK